MNDKEKIKIDVLAKRVDMSFEVSRSNAQAFIANSGNKKALNAVLERQEKHSASITINDNSHHSETGLPKDPGYFECGLSNDLKTSIRRMEESWKIEDSGGKDYHWDIAWCELNADINAAEVNQEIAPGQAWYLREKYLRMKKDD